MLTIYIDILGRLINDLVWEVSQIDMLKTVFKNVVTDPKLVWRRWLLAISGDKTLG